MTNLNTPKAVIYCRVSSKAQVKKGDGLGSQETRCREYAKHRGYKVINVFKEKGVSGKMINRPSMQDMLKFLKQQNDKTLTVLIDDISRLARGMEAHIQLRYAIASVGAKLESPSHEFKDDSDSQLVENLLASVSQHHRQKNAEQVVNRMQARIIRGYWTFSPVLGYKYTKEEQHGKILVHKEPAASLIREAFEGYATGRFASQAEVKQFLDRSPGFPKNKKGEVYFQTVQKLLTNPIYAGFIDVPKWNISRQPGKHEPIISFETWKNVQDRLKGQAHTPAREDLHNDFPLRGFVACASCGKTRHRRMDQGTEQSIPLLSLPDQGMC